MNILMVKKLQERFMKRKWKKKKKRKITKSLELQKWYRKKVIKSMLNGKDMIIHLIVVYKTDIL